MRATNSSNEELKELIFEIRKVASVEKSPFWKRVASDLSKPSRQRRAVNLSRINRHTKADDIVVIPGKVLSVGDVDHKVQVAAYTFSKNAKEKIAQANGKVLSITELLKSNPKAKGLRIIG